MKPAIDPTPTAALRVVLDGEPVLAYPGESILDVARRNGVEIPTLCHDPRLKPVGACRSCLVEISGSRRLVPACHTPVQADLAITTDSARIDRHRRLLLQLYGADLPPSDLEPDLPNAVRELSELYGATLDWPRLESHRRGRPIDDNPFVAFIPERCILCAKCTRYCEEIEAVNAIALANRGSQTTISTAEGITLLDSSCELCGGCIDVCPTGAMTEQIRLDDDPAPASSLEKVRTTCNYCGVGCQLDLNVRRDAETPHGRIVKVTAPPPGTTTNDGNLCVKGRFGFEFVTHPERLTTPLIRDASGTLQPATWEDALTRAATGLLGVKARHSADALGFVSSARCTVEENYLVQKLARAVFGTNNVHQCAAT